MDSQLEPDRLKRLNVSLEKALAYIFYKRNGGFWGTFTAEHKFSFSFDIPTACCDGTNVLINPDFWEKLETESQATLAVHEVSHTARQHFGRIQGRNPLLWNIAGDYVINADLLHDGYSFKGLEDGCLDMQYHGWSTEAVYEELISAGSGGNKPKPWMGSDDIKEVEPTVEQQREVLERLVRAHQVHRMTGKPFGDLPPEIQATIKTTLRQDIPWYVMLQRFFTELCRDDYTWKKPSRRFEDEYMPSLYGEGKLTKLNWYFDVSASVTDEQEAACFSNLRYMHQSLQPELLNFVTFDTEIKEQRQYTANDRLDDIQIINGGGTSLEPVLEHIKETRPVAAVIFSDLYCKPMREDPGIPIFWVVLDNPNAQVPFGQMTHLQT